jgi:ribosomal protein L37AE/L43A
MKPICPDCKCETIYYRKKVNMFVCRRCGNEWTKEVKMVEVKEIEE